MSKLLKIDGLRVDYTADHSSLPAIAGLSLTVDKGERVAIIGESGSGKSTLALAIAGLLPGNARMSGRIEWPGLDHRPLNGADIGFVFQDAGGTLDPVMSIGRQVAEVVRAHHGGDVPSAKMRALALLAQVRLPEPSSIYRAFPHQLSGGQKQRVGIAAAIAGAPSLLIADEPTSALDTIVQAEIVALIDSLVLNTGMALLLISHDIALAASHSDRIVVMRNGLAVEVANVRQLVETPRETYTRTLMAATPPLPQRLSTGQGLD